jgi:hypothetical protein
MYDYIIEDLTIGFNFFRIEANANRGSVELRFFQTPLETIKQTLEINGIDFYDEEIQKYIEDYDF